MHQARSLSRCAYLYVIFAGSENSKPCKYILQVLSRRKAYLLNFDDYALMEM